MISVETLTMPWCAVINCSVGKTLHGFPDPGKKALRKKWLEQINRENYTITKDPKVCEKHFEDTAFIPAAENKDSQGRARKRRHLKENAYPTLFLRPPPEPNPTTRKRRAIEDEEIIPMKDFKKKVP